MKCDVVIPIYNQLNWVQMCVKSVFCNTNMEIINKVYLIDDCSSEETKEGLKVLKNKYGDKIELIHNKTNKGFLKNCNYAFEIFKADYILLLNSDCLVSNNAIEKMMNAMMNDKKIGLLCPISSKAANLSFPLIEGLDYQKINKLFEKQFNKMTFDACTVVGNCLMISKNCIDKVGYFDEIFEKGYSEETDYQFKALSKGFKAKVLIDTYVFHECRVSFGEDEAQLKRREKHLQIFFERWGEEYNILYEKYCKNDPIEYIKNNLKIDYNDLCINYKLTKKINQYEIDILNNLIIENNNISIFVSKRNNEWKKYNTLFYPSINKKLKVGR